MAWAVAFYRSDAGTVPAREFLTSCPTNVRRKLLAILEVVRVAPPPSFSGGGMWEAMHGTMNGYYEIRTTGSGRRHYRLYCILDNGTKAELKERGFHEPYIVVLNGLVKPNRLALLRQRLQAACPQARRALPLDAAAAGRCVTRARREALGVSQEDLAHEAGMDRSSRWSARARSTDPRGLRAAYRSAAAAIVRRMSEILRNRRSGSSGDAMKPRSR